MRVRRSSRPSMRTKFFHFGQRTAHPLTFLPYDSDNFLLLTTGYDGNPFFYYPAFLAAYFLFYHLTRLRPVSDLFYYLSPDRFFVQYMAPETKLKDLTERQSEDPGQRGNSSTE